jgi:hypothetical protein
MLCQAHHIAVIAAGMNCVQSRDNAIGANAGAH